MKVTAHIVATALLAGALAAQTAPASQTVQPNPPQIQAPKKDAGATKSPAKNPFKPKAKSAQPPTQPAKTQGKSAAQPTPAQPAKAQAKTSTQTAKTQAKAAAQPAKTQAAKPQAKTPASQKAAPKQAAPVQAKAAPKPENTKPAEVKKEPSSEVVESAPRKLPSPGKRDPFVSPLASGAHGPGAGCTTGKKCLIVDQIVLKGIVQMKSGNFALVENISKRPYVLHERDSLFNGSVVKITGDSVVFREESNDILGRPISKEVVKKVSAPAV
ncbi:MAG: hypothetical protein DMG64_05995 [Acidobacteria bacterium]|nr:MAG: hypothetical protein DMG64_05995 [Acidobacteriota bacterium]PYY20989.1 MAG: hypothetical protein DMG62_20830 [Acidobacteriota bacterium]